MKRLLNIIIISTFFTMPMLGKELTIKGISIDTDFRKVKDILKKKGFSCTTIITDKDHGIHICKKGIHSRSKLRKLYNSPEEDITVKLRGVYDDKIKKYFPEFVYEKTIERIIVSCRVINSCNKMDLVQKKIESDYASSITRHKQYKHRLQSEKTTIIVSRNSDYIDIQRENMSEEQQSIMNKVKVREAEFMAEEIDLD